VLVTTNGSIRTASVLRVFRTATGEGYPVGLINTPAPGYWVQWCREGSRRERILDVKWQDGRREIDRDTEIAVDILCEYLANALDALQDSRIVGSSGDGSLPEPR
jgi:hypothetical protein